MALEARLVLRYGIEHTGDTVRDVVAHHISHIQAGDYDARYGVQQVHVVALVDGHVGREQPGDAVDEPLEDEGRRTCDHSDHQGQDDDEGLLLDVALAPSEKGLEPAVET